MKLFNVDLGIPLLFASSLRQFALSRLSQSPAPCQSLPRRLVGHHLRLLLPSCRVSARPNVWVMVRVLPLQRVRSCENCRRRFCSVREDIGVATCNICNNLSHSCS
jgi:hypothetical protein